MLLEDTQKSTSPVKDVSPHFPIFKDFKDASYAQRYNILCRKLMQKQLYTVAALLVSPRSAVDTGSYKNLSDMTSLCTFVSEFAGHIASEAARQKEYRK